MKIGILTFHKSINYGAVTQCYALTQELKKRFPQDTVEVIDYVPAFRIERYKPTVHNYLFGSIRKKNSIKNNLKIFISQLIKLIFHPNIYRNTKKRYFAFNKSMEILPLSDEAYVTDDVTQFNRMIYNKYDIIITGSDCIWEWSTVPLPNAYYLYGDFGATKMSFAASVGTDDYSLLNDTEKSILKKSVSDFYYIGVRDTSSEYVLQQLQLPNLTWSHNCDPTTLLDISTLYEYKHKVQSKINKLCVKKDKIKVAVMGSEQYGKIARQVFGDNAIYFALYTPNKYCDYQLTDLTVLEWAACFSLFDITFTTFFHGTMLSLVNLTPVISFDYLPEKKNQITKLRELYKRLNLEDFYCRVDGSISEAQITDITQKAKEYVKVPPKERILDALKREAYTAESFFTALHKIHQGDN